jgi:hypothetical protein
LIRDGEVAQFCSGFRPDEGAVEVPDEVIKDPDRFEYMDGRFIQRFETETKTETPTLEGRVSAIEKQLIQLMAQTYESK